MIILIVAVAILIYSLLTATILFHFCFSENLSKKFGSEVNELWNNFGSDFTYPGNLPAYVEEYFEEQERNGLDVVQGRIQCTPLPGTILTEQLSRMDDDIKAIKGKVLLTNLKLWLA